MIGQKRCISAPKGRTTIAQAEGLGCDVPALKAPKGANFWMRVECSIVRPFRALALYSAGRFVVQFFRLDQPFVLGLSQAQFLSFGTEAVSGSPDELRALVAGEVDKIKRVAKAVGATAD